MGLGPSVDATRPADAAALLRTTDAVRTRSAHLLDRARSGDSRWFTVDDSMVDRTAHDVATVTRERYPDLNIPYHSRWRHFEAGGIDRKRRLDDMLRTAEAGERARAMMDLTVVSVLLDAGAGADWGYTEVRGDARATFTRSEGLGVASWHAFASGVFSSDASRPLQVDAHGLRTLTVERLAAAFQVTDDNPLVGLDGRVALMRRLGDVMAAQPEVFGVSARPGALFDEHVAAGAVHAHDILARLLTSLSPIWPSRNMIGDIAVGDCWRHDGVSGPGLTAGWLPLHKLSQWLTYSLIEPLLWAGVEVAGIEALTGLPEYRNGGLLIDGGVLRLRDQAAAQQSWNAGDELIVEWRALTVSLLDELAPLVRALLGADAQRMPLACILEGGTWAAGRASAQRLRGGLPPLSVTSDGTVF